MQKAVLSVFFIFPYYDNVVLICIINAFQNVIFRYLELTNSRYHVSLILPVILSSQSS